jgi:hypothetical protein
VRHLGCREIDRTRHFVTGRDAASHSVREPHSTREDDLKQRFGDLLNLNDLAEVLRYPSAHAIRKARIRGRLPIELIQMPGRRGWFATARAVAKLLDSLESQ